MLDYVVALLAGFTAGRIGHIFGGQIMWIPHHWIFGLLVVFVGVVCVFIKKIKYLGIILVFVGLGIFVSDFKDFLQMRIWEPDDAPIIKFFGID